MNNLFRIFAVLVILGLPPVATAGGPEDCHFHDDEPATQRVISGCATRRLQSLAQSGAVAKAWANASPSAFEQIDGQRGRQWRVVFDGAPGDVKGGERLYLFFTREGNYISHSFTGK